MHARTSRFSLRIFVSCSADALVANDDTIMRENGPPKKPELVVVPIWIFNSPDLTPPFQELSLKCDRTTNEQMSNAMQEFMARLRPRSPRWAPVSLG
jgi:hypothetical protein